MNLYTVKKEENNLRIDKFVSNVLPGVSRSFLSKNIRGFVKVDEKEVKQSYKLQEGQKIEIDIPKLKEKYEQELSKGEWESNIVAQVGELNIHFEDKDFLVLNKSAGIPVHPGIGHESDTLANYVKQYLMEKGEFDYGVKRAGIVHRLDMPVSGLIVFAKNRNSQKHLAGEFENHRVLKIYLADYEVLEDKKIFKEFKKEDSIYQVIEDFKKDLTLNLQDWYEISGSMKRDPSNRKRMLFQRGIYNKSLRYAQSYLLPLSTRRMYVLIKTGRMHQIRATLRSLGFVLKGDKLYGYKKEPEKEIGLRSVILGFVDMNGVKKVFKDLNSFR